MTDLTISATTLASVPHRRSRKDVVVLNRSYLMPGGESRSTAIADARLTRAILLEGNGDHHDDS